MGTLEKVLGCVGAPEQHFRRLRGVGHGGAEILGRRSPELLPAAHFGGDPVDTLLAEAAAAVKDLELASRPAVTCSPW